MKFVRDYFPQATFKKIYDANTDGWDSDDFHRCCDNKGWTLTIVLTTTNFIFGGFTIAEFESTNIRKPGRHSFLFSVNEGTTYPIADGDITAIRCNGAYCAVFGTSGQ